MAGNISTELKSRVFSNYDDVLSVVGGFGVNQPKAMIGVASSCAGLFGYNRVEHLFNVAADALAVPDLFYSGAKAIRSGDAFMQAVYKQNFSASVSEGWECLAKIADTVADVVAITRLIATSERRRISPALSAVETVCLFFSTVKSIYDSVVTLREETNPDLTNRVLTCVIHDDKTKSVWSLARDISSLVLPIIGILGFVLAPIFTFAASMVYFVTSFVSYLQEKNKERCCLDTVFGI